MFNITFSTKSVPYFYLCIPFLSAFYQQYYQNKNFYPIPGPGDYAGYAHDTSPVILVHGGAGEVKPENYYKKVSWIYLTDRESLALMSSLMV